MWQRTNVQDYRTITEKFSDYKSNLFLVKVLKYFADLHLNNFFHGNIKP
jgi:hypothetical protein